MPVAPPVEFSPLRPLAPAVPKLPPAAPPPAPLAGPFWPSRLPHVTWAPAPVTPSRLLLTRSTPSIEIDVCATSTSGFAPLAVTVAPLLIEIVSAVTTHSDGPLACATIAVQLP